MPKKKKKLSKEELAEALNDILDTDIKFTKLSYNELEQLAKALERLLIEKEKQESKEFSFKKLNKLKKLLAQLGIEFLSNWNGPVVKALREIFLESLEKEEEEENEEEEDEED